MKNPLARSLPPAPRPLDRQSHSGFPWFAWLVIFASLALFGGSALLLVSLVRRALALFFG